VENVRAAREQIKEYDLNKSRWKSNNEMKYIDIFYVKKYCVTFFPKETFLSWQSGMEYILWITN
jgi:hypothetical protein